MPGDVCFQTQYWEGRDRIESLAGQTRLRLSIQTHKHLHAHKHTHRKVNEYMVSEVQSIMVMKGSMEAQMQMWCQRRKCYILQATEI